jgi:leucyl/phenylalanyl-tRNA--protein transferase
MDALTPELLVDAYQRGFFPMADPEIGLLEWYRPDPRAIIELDGLHVSRTLSRTIRSGQFSIRTDSAFGQVLRACAAPAAGREQTWIDDRIAAACEVLHTRGSAHSVEAWRGGELVGGLYGVRLGGAFFGESMFSRPEGGRDASKVCLAWLVSHLGAIGASLLDVQFMNPHLERLGAVEISDAAYIARLESAIGLAVEWQ